MRFEHQVREGLNTSLIFKMEGPGWVSQRGLSDLRVDGDDGEPIPRLRLEERVRRFPW